MPVINPIKAVITGFVAVINPFKAVITGYMTVITINKHMKNRAAPARRKFIDEQGQPFSYSDSSLIFSSKDDSAYFSLSFSTYSVLRLERRRPFYVQGTPTLFGVSDSLRSGLQVKHR